MQVRKTLWLIISCFLFLSFVSKNDSKLVSQNVGDIPVYDFETLEPLLYTNSEKIHIVNFWAMWCAPCVKELPIFQEFERNNPNVELTFVSLDFIEEIETKLKPFLKKKGITSKVILLDEGDANSWINKIDPNWSGTLPFTIVFNNKTRVFHEGSFENTQELENEILKLKTDNEKK
ncbi:TlpA family protein disulfide reductase [Arcticibacterium luteifluviistationis]|uniref:Thioredoxin n=1 Tax=Arcticibacterium luteifluviistationis TaxID=1784714 RepID=A0A2Z4G7V8_9BACT|nr:TlpA disulfide reductase family protein [Arcticibacterium luteifluviistationis]AWV97158.1 thioredoxin [Arcticibacterium luteifluviistationis]